MTFSSPALTELEAEMLKATHRAEAEAEIRAAILRSLLPSCWKVKVHNCERRSDRPPWFKITGTHAGLAVIEIVGGTNPGKVFVTIDNGPGIVESLGVSTHNVVWSSTEAAVEGLKKHMLAKLARVQKQATPFL